MGNEYSENSEIIENGNNDESIAKSTGSTNANQTIDDVKYENSNDKEIESSSITIIHISDTHNLHNQLVLPAGDMLIHTGDFCNNATRDEYTKFNQFLGKYTSKYPLGIFVILGNHDYKFLDGTGHSDKLIRIMADDKLRKTYFNQLLPNAHIIDNETVSIKVKNDHILTMFGAPWTPFQSKPTYPDKVPKVGTGHDRVLQEWKKNNNYTSQTMPNFYNQIPENVDILLSHIPPFGVFDHMPMGIHWGSSSILLKNIYNKNIRSMLFGHVHAQRGYWERIKVKDKHKKWKIIGGCQYAKKTNDSRKVGIIHDLMMGKNGNDEKAVQFVANSALMSDRTVQKFAKKKIVGRPRVINACVIDGKWVFHNI